MYNRFWSFLYYQFFILGRQCDVYTYVQFISLNNGLKVHPLTEKSLKLTLLYG